jgi:hypothetical protein
VYGTCSGPCPMVVSGISGGEIRGSATRADILLVCGP